MAETSGSGIWLLLLETTGNQKHIFDTNKLAENVGASQQLFQIGQQDVLAATQHWLPEVTSVQDTLIPEKNPPIDGGNRDGVEIWYLSSGKAMIFCGTRDIARAIVQNVTRKALLDYPGVVVRGAIVGISQFTVSGISDAVEGVHRRLEQKRSHLPPMESRFQSLPIVTPCRNSGLPASHLFSESPKSQPIPISTVVHKKRQLRDAAVERMKELCESTHAEKLRFARDLKELEQWFGDTRFVAVIHADGTGIGLLFQKFRDLKNWQSPREFIDALRHFSEAMDQVTRDAFAAAVFKMAVDDLHAVDFDPRGHWRVPILPLILGGDDVTLLMVGELAVSFMTFFLQEWESHIARCDKIAPFVKKAYGLERLGMAAGIAIVKPHFPFSIAYRLAEGLATNAKREVKQRCRLKNGDGVLPVSVFDFHVHHSSSGDEIDDVRRSVEFESQASVADATLSRWKLWGGPYLVTPPNSLWDANTPTPCQSDPTEWFQHRTSDRLREQIDAISQTVSDEEGRSILPNSQLHAIRAALFNGLPASDAQVKLVRHRYDGLDGRLWEKLCVAGDSVFWIDRPIGGGASVACSATSLMDAMSLKKLRTETLEKADD